MISQKEKDILLNVIDLYKDMPNLWNKNHNEYKNKSIRYEGFRVLLELYKNFDGDATIKTIKRRLENMRTAYFKEVKKVNASKHTGAGSQDLYVPSLWYFDALSFLGSATESCRPITDSLENENLQNSSSTEEENQAGPSSAVTVPTKKKKRSISLKQEKLVDTAEKLMSQKEEEWEVIGKSIGLQLRDLKGRDLTIAQKLIADVIYYAKIGRLADDAYIVLGSRSFPSPSFSNTSDNSSTSHVASSHPSHHQIQSSNPTPQYCPSHYSSPQYHHHIIQRHSSPSPRLKSQPSPQFNPHVQSPQPLPQHLTQSPHTSPQYLIQLPQPSPRHEIQPSPQFNPHVQSPQPIPQHLTQSPHTSPQYLIQSSQPSPRHEIQPSPQINPHVQSPQPIPQHLTQSPHTSPQYLIQSSQPSPRHEIQPSPQINPHVQSPQPIPQHLTQSPHTSPQYLIQSPQLSPRHQDQFNIQEFDSPQIHIPDQPQYAIQFPIRTQTSSSDTFHPSSPSATSDIQRTKHIDIKEYLIFKK